MKKKLLDNFDHAKTPPIKFEFQCSSAEGGLIERAIIQSAKPGAKSVRFDAPLP